MAEHFPTFARASRVTRSGLRGLGDRVRRGLVTERGLLRLGLYLGLLLCVVDLVAVLSPVAQWLSLQSPYLVNLYGYAPDGVQPVGTTGSVLLDVVRRPVGLVVMMMGPPPTAMVELFLCLAGLAASSRPPASRGGEPLPPGP